MLLELLVVKQLHSGSSVDPSLLSNGLIGFDIDLDPLGAPAQLIEHALMMDITDLDEFGEINRDSNLVEAARQLQQQIPRIEALMTEAEEEAKAADAARWATWCDRSLATGGRAFHRLSKVPQPMAAPVAPDVDGGLTAEPGAVLREEAGKLQKLWAADPRIRPPHDRRGVVRGCEAVAVAMGGGETPPPSDAQRAAAKACADALRADLFPELREWALDGFGLSEADCDLVVCHTVPGAALQP